MNQNLGNKHVTSVFV